MRVSTLKHWTADRTNERKAMNVSFRKDGNEEKRQINKFYEFGSWNDKALCIQKLSR